METSKVTVNLKILKRSRTPRRILFTKEVNETLEEFKPVFPDQFLLIGERNCIVQYYQQLKEYDEKIEIEMVNAEDYDEQAAIKELDSTAIYPKMFKKIHDDKYLNDDEKKNHLVQAMIPGSRAHRFPHTEENN
ncbi:hypothetical protein LAZ67_11002107 [Cordylochernes scorpioides]|uniref:Uncharacterized protein n=1 Tax=Cordylochernes scorpioides TaxID=51811 RepID=A0ABY6L2E4_9ARAC|nr:hypothetical protein LAZ67_11002107 [Cordylochernes scorpioides]